LQATAQRRGSVIILLALFLGTAVLPSTAHIPASTASVQSLPDAQKLVEQGSTLYQAERFNNAAKAFQQAAAAFKAQGDGLRYAMTLCNLSLAYQQLGQWQEAQSAIREAIASLHAESLNLLQTRQNLGSSTERSSILAQALDVQGRLQLAQGQAEIAQKTWQRAAEIYKQLGDETALTRNSINQAQAMRALGLYLQAEKTLTKVQEILQKQPDSPLKATGLRSLGNVWRVVGDLSKSLRVLEESLAVAKRVQDPGAIADANLSLGNTARAQADTKAALTYYQDAAAASALPTKRIQAQLNQLSLLLETKQSSGAQALWPQIQSQIANLPLSRMAIYARINFAQSLTRLRQDTTTDSPSWLDIAQLLSTGVEQAKSLKDQRAESYALGTLGGLYEQTKQLSSAQDLTEKALLITQTIDAPDIAYQWEWQLGRLLKTKGDIKRAIAAYDEAYKTLKSLRRDLVAINPDVQFSFRESVEPVYRQFVDLLLQTEGNSEPSQKNLAQARTVIESLQLAELDNFFREACLVAKVDIDKVLDRQAPTAAVIYPIILPDRVEVILKLVNQNLRRYTTAVGQEEVERTLDDLQQKITKPHTLREVQSLSQQVYNWLLKPAFADLARSDVKTLVFVLDGSLRNIPMAVLYDGKQYLVENYSIALTPGLQLTDPKPLTRKQLKTIAAGVSEPRPGFSGLPNVKRELEEIQSKVPSQVLFNEQFTTQAFQNQVNSLPFPVVHLATHGQFSSDADNTFVLAWDEKIKVNQLSNLLRTRDQSRPDAIELLILSACQTAAGDKRAALGLAGVAVRAGARSTLASLWNVNDQSTALLMGQFYQVLANKAVPKAEALRQAQLALLKNPKYALPMFWAPYVLVGNWL
jgi:CHAT domain-containing protein